MEVFKNIFDNLGITEFARPSLGISDILDILIVAYIIYKIIFWIKETRAWVLFKGILVIFALAAVAMLLKLNTILWILSNTISVGIIAVIVVFHTLLTAWIVHQMIEYCHIDTSKILMNLHL